MKLYLPKFIVIASAKKIIRETLRLREKLAKRKHPRIFATLRETLEIIVKKKFVQ